MVEIIRVKKVGTKAIVALIFKKMKLKPSAFKKNKFVDNELTKSLISDDDSIYLEDETGRVALDLSEIQPIRENNSYFGLK